MRSTIAVLAIAFALFATPSTATIRIAIVGDSVASGEGNPDSPVPFVMWRGRNGRGRTSEDFTCHRSTSAGFVQAAERLASDLAATTREAVVVETFACTGAKTLGVRRAQLPRLANDPQFDDAATNDRIDALIMSVGANNMGFGPIAARCLHPDDCRSLVQPGLDGLPASYASLQRAIERLGSRVANVFLVEYFDPSVGPDGPCGPGIDDEAHRPRLASRDIAVWGIGYYEARWTSETLLPALNRELAKAAEKHGWHYVGGAAEAFKGHGYCADDRWVRNLNDSVTLQGDYMGILHPNRAGHDKLRDLVLAALAPFRDTLTEPSRVTFAGNPGWVASEGGAGTLRQVAFLKISPSLDVAVPSPPGFVGDGRRQRVSADMLLRGPGNGPAWTLREVESGAAGVEPPSGEHWAAAVRSCNSLRCSGWSAPVASPPVAPRMTWLVRTSGGIRPRWSASPRNGVYQVAVSAGNKVWDVYRVAATAGASEETVTTQTSTRYSEAPTVTLPPNVDRRPDSPTVEHTDPFKLPVTRVVHVRGCNQTGCSAWTSGADFINALATPAPGPFQVVMFRPGEDTGSRRSVWPAVPGANGYQIARYRRDGSFQLSLLDQPFALMTSGGEHTGFRVRACNLGGCSPWSGAVMLDSSAGSPAAPSNAPLPENRSMAEVTAEPPRDLLPPQ